ncbi:MAG: hypothetical protein M0C28_05175 [Candidatus Moduliflexus flocculans]|nr:hypothetical protein [Candidatus Moduliflexus flocculans]
MARASRPRRGSKNVSVSKVKPSFFFRSALGSIEEFAPRRMLLGGAIVFSVATSTFSAPLIGVEVRGPIGHAPRRAALFRRSCSWRPGQPPAARRSGITSTRS